MDTDLDQTDFVCVPILIQRHFKFKSIVWFCDEINAMQSLNDKQMQI